MSGFTWFALLYGLVMGLLIGSPNYVDGQLLDEARQSIAQCQKDLPRSQVCELTAKIKERKE